MKKSIAFILILCLSIIGLSGCGTAGSALDPEHPVNLSIWHVYGSQTESPLNDAIEEFNRTVGKEKGVAVTVVSVTDSSSIDEALTKAAEQSGSAVELPDLFTAYPRVAENIGTDRLLDWGEYFSEKELSLYIQDFLSEGYIDGRLLALPIAKSTELFFLNETCFDEFSSASGTETGDLNSFEGIFDACCEYFDYSGGKNLFQINDYYNYFYAAVQSMGGEFIKDGNIDCSSDEFEKAFRTMAKAAVYGGICTGDGYASDRWKTGEILCNIGSSAGILYLRDYITYEDGSEKDIVTSVCPYPVYEGAEPVVVQRGAGLFAVKSDDPAKNEAAAVFAKWITEPDNNLSFVTKAGYLPVTDTAFDQLFDNMETVVNEKYRLLYSAVGEMLESYSFISLPLYEGSGEVQKNFEDIMKTALTNAHEEYLTRTGRGENSDTVLSDLTDSTLALVQAQLR